MFEQLRNKTFLSVTLILLAVVSACSQEAQSVNEVNPEIIFAQEKHEGKLTVHFFHLEYPERYEKTGESILITTPKGQTILIDAGIPKVGPVVNDYLDELGIDKIDYAMPSHPHIDHIGGFLTLFEKKEIGKVIEINLPHEESEVYQVYSEMIEKNNFTVEYAEEGNVYKIEDNITLEILNPMKGLSPETYDFTSLTPGIINDVSMVIKMTHKDNIFLFTGDIYKGVEHELIQKYGDELDVDVVVSPHHGNGTSNSDKFIETTNPDITLIPSNIVFDLNVVEAYKEHGSEVFISKYDGNVLLTSDGKKIDVYREKESTEIEDDDLDGIEE